MIKSVGNISPDPDPELFLAYFVIFCRELFTNTWLSHGLVTGSGALIMLIQKNFVTKKFCLPLQTSKNSGPPFLLWKLWVNPIEKHVNSIFAGKFVNFFQALKGHPFLHQPPQQVFVNGPLNGSFSKSQLLMSVTVWSFNWIKHNTLITH